MDVRTDFVARLRLHGPLIQAPMAGGAMTPELVAAVSNAGAVGPLGEAYLSPSELHTAIPKSRCLPPATPFAVNLFAPCAEPVLSENQIQAAIAATKSYRQELGISSPALSLRKVQIRKVSKRLLWGADRKISSANFSMVGDAGTDPTEPSKQALV
jgi:NAD(P)H-dependent flavin oxidoreductase YrpB (nitropropane dioxygenase family)